MPIVLFLTKVLGEEQDVKPLVSAGDSITINGKVYEFVANGKRTSNENAIGVDMGEGFETAAEAAQALADAVNGVDSSKIIARANGKSVIFSSKYDNRATTVEAVYNAPKVDLPKTAHALRLQIGDTSEEFNQMDVGINAVNCYEMGLSDISISTQDGASDAMAKIKKAINYVSDVRGGLGATQNRLDHIVNNLSVIQENIQDAESTIRDVDVAKEIIEYTKKQHSGTIRAGYACAGKPTAAGRFAATPVIHRFIFPVLAKRGSGQCPVLISILCIICKQRSFFLFFPNFY